MNTNSINFESFIEWDNSPFILFDSQQKIRYLNNAAEILFGYVSKQELYNLAVTYAPQDFGYKTTTLTLNYDSFIFYGFTVGYENEDDISIRLYNMPRLKPTRRIEKDKLISTDINILLEANIALFKTKNHNKLQLLADQDLPVFKINQNNFSKLLRKTLDSFRASDSIDITLKLLIGQHVIIEDKKESIVHLSIFANGRYVDSDEELRILASQSQIKYLIKENAVILEIPLLR